MIKLKQFVASHTNGELRKLKGVYCFTFPNGKRYVGITYGTGSFGNRFSNHLKAVKKGSFYPVHCAIRKHGWDNIKKEILIISDDPEYSKSMEIKLIDVWKLNIRKHGIEARGYNLTDGGDGVSGPTGKPAWNKGKTGYYNHPEEIKETIGQHSKENWLDKDYRKSHIELLLNRHIKDPNLRFRMGDASRKKHKKYIYEIYFEDGQVVRPEHWREFIRDIFNGNAGLAGNIRQMLQGKRGRLHDIIRVIKYDLNNNMILDSLVERERFLLERKQYMKTNRKPNKGCSYIVKEPDGKEIEISHLSNYCKEKNISIHSLMRKYKDYYPGVNGFKIIKKIGWKSG